MPRGRRFGKIPHARAALAEPVARAFPRHQGSLVDDCPGWNHCPARPRAAGGVFAVGPLEGLDRCGDPVLLAGRGRGASAPGRPGSVFSPTTSICWPAPARAPWLYPIKAHHYSPVIAALFKLTAQGVIGAAAWHLLAHAAHGVNILLVWLILVRGLGDRPALRLGGDDALRAGGSGVRGDRLGGRPGLCAGGIHAAGRGLYWPKSIVATQA